MMILDFLFTSFWTVIAIGGLVAAVAVFGFTTKFGLPNFIQTPLVCLCVALSGYAFGYMEGSDRTAENLAALQTKLKLDARIAKEALAEAQERFKQGLQIDAQISDAENHVDNDCVSSDDDLDRVRSIFEDLRTPGTSDGPSGEQPTANPH